MKYQLDKIVDGLDEDSPVAIPIQIANVISAMVAGGMYVPSDRIPGQRAVIDAGISAWVWEKAQRLLAFDDVIIQERTQPYRIAPAGVEAAKARIDRVFKRQIDELAVLVHYSGYDEARIGDRFITRCDGLTKKRMES